MAISSIVDRLIMWQKGPQVNAERAHEGAPRGIFAVTRRRMLAIPPLLWAVRLRGAMRKPAPPRNIPGSLAAVRDIVTPSTQFFVRDHFEEPDLSLTEWKLSIEGHVERPFEIGFSELLLAPSMERAVTLECAGNGSPGFAVSTARWTGVPLSFLLRAAKPRSEAAAVMLQGWDEGLLFDKAARGPYTRLLPLSDCLAPEAMVAYQLNGQLLPRANGFPARALLPGWYGMDSVKWLRRIAVVPRGERPAAFFDSGMDQLYMRVYQGEPMARRLGRLQLKSEISFPIDGARLPAGVQQIRGFAWGSESPVRGIMVSVDDGHTWQPAAIQKAGDRYVWTRWSFQWNAKPGEHTLLSRAEDESGGMQPLVRDPLRVDGYEANQCARVRCSVI